jgi:hypothetical protein
MENEKYPIREDWEDYYNVLENIRQMGICNMWGGRCPIQASLSGTFKKRRPRNFSKLDS